MLPHIPALVQNGIASLKIEGRMRTAEFLAPVVALYRKAVDAYFADPAGYATNAGDMHKLFAQRVREMTTAHMFANPGGEGVDTTGKREPRFFSHAAPAAAVDRRTGCGARTPVPKCPELIVHVSTVARPRRPRRPAPTPSISAARASACMAESPAWTPSAAFARQAAPGRHPHRRDDAAHLPTSGTWPEWRQRLHPVHGAGEYHHRRVQSRQPSDGPRPRCRDILADYSLNTANAIAADELSTLGAQRVTASVELTFQQLSQFAKAVRMPVEVIGQGPRLRHADGALRPGGGRAGRIPRTSARCRADGAVMPCRTRPRRSSRWRRTAGAAITSSPPRTSACCPTSRECWPWASPACESRASWTSPKPSRS